MKNLLDTLKPEQLNQVRLVELDKEEILFNEGDFCESVGVVITGEIEITSFSYAGGQLVFNRLSEGMVFGNNLLFSSDPHYKGSVIAKKPAKIGLIYKNSLIFLLKTNDEFMNLYLRLQSDTAKELNAKIKLLSRPGAEERFLYYLRSKGGKIEYHSVTRLATILSIQRETLSRVLNRLVKEKQIVKTKHIIKEI